MPWKKKGLIFVPDGKSDLMFSHAAIPFLDEQDISTLRIYFSSRNRQGKSLPFSIDVESLDLSKVISINQKPIIELGGLGTFDDSGIMPSCIVNWSGLKYMYYIAWNPQVNVSYRLSIGLAISEDGGKTFQKHSIGPICDRSIDEPYFNTAPFVLVENGIWRMWYISCTEWKMINNYPEPKYHVKYCESKDGIRWKKSGHICIDYDDFAEAIGRPSVFFETGIYKMYFSYRKITDYRTDKNNSYRLGYAESPDGLKWEILNDRVFIETSNDPNEWDYLMMEYCHVYILNGKKIMLYNGNGFGKSGFGYAIYE